MEVLVRTTATAKAHELVMRHGRNATASQILNPGIVHWFNAREDAVAGYVRRGSWLVVAGEPVCSLQKLPEAVREFEAHARSRNLRVCYMCASGSMRDLFAGSGDHSTVTVGAQPVWSPSAWPGIVSARGSLRAQLNRSLNKGVRIESMPPAAGAVHAGVRHTLSEWLHSRRLPPMRFLVEPRVLSGVVDDRLLFVARHAGRIVAILVA